MLINWLVIGYDRDEDQVFWNVIPAESDQLARQRFKRLRNDYAVIVDSMPASDLLGVAQRCQMSVEEAETQFRGIEEDCGYERAEDYEVSAVGLIG